MKYEYEKSFPFAVYVTNLGKYNDGTLQGEWIEMPTTPEHMREVFDRIGIGSNDEYGQTYEEWFVTDYDDYSGIHITKDMGEYPNLDELNYLAAKLDDMSDGQYQAFCAAIESGDYGTEIQDYINVAESVDDIRLIPGIETDADYGHYIVETGYIMVPDDIRPYIDYEAIGRDWSYDGMMTSYGYLENADIRQVYDGKPENIPDEYRIITADSAQEFQENTAQDEPDLKAWQKHEAIDRMHILHMMPEAVHAYEEGRVMQSQEPYGILYDISPEQKEKISEFEEKYNTEVYHVIHGNYEFYSGDIMSFDTYLYVSASPEEWPEDREDLKAGYQYAHVENLAEPYLSEIGMVGVAPANGGLHRNDKGYDFESMVLTPEELADKLDQHAYNTDPYGYKDSYDSREDGRAQILSDIQSGGERLEGIKDSLNETIAESADQKTIDSAKDLLEDIQRFEEDRGTIEADLLTHEHSLKLS